MKVQILCHVRKKCGKGNERVRISGNLEKEIFFRTSGKSKKEEKVMKKQGF